MILFKSRQEKVNAEQYFIKSMVGKRTLVFSLFPTKLCNGQIAWLQFIWADIEAHKSDFSNTYLRNERAEYFKTEKGYDE